MNPAKTQPRTPSEIAASDRLLEAASKTIGLFRLLAVSASIDHGKPLTPPSREEAEGILWLAASVGEDLNQAIREALPPVSGGQSNPPDSRP